MTNAIDESVQRAAAGKKAQGRSKGGVWRLRQKSKGHVASAASRAVTRGFYTKVFSASPEDLILMIRQGVPASDAKRIIKDLGVEQKVFYHALGLKTATVNRKAKRNDLLSSGESERLLGVAKLVGQLEMIISESGDPEGFDAPEWMSTWLREPLPALGWEKPISFLDTMEGQALVSDALARIQSGAYA